MAIMHRRIKEYLNKFKPGSIFYIRSRPDYLNYGITVLFPPAQTPNGYIVEGFYITAGGKTSRGTIPIYDNSINIRGYLVQDYIEFKEDYEKI